MSDYFAGDNHGNVAEFDLGIGGFGIPDGQGGFLPGALTPVTMSGLSTRLETYETSDGRAHSGGRVRSAEVQLGLYLAGDPVQAALIDAWWAASRAGLPGYKLPCTLTIRETSGEVAEVWEIEQVFISGFDPASLDRNAPDAAMSTVTLTVFNAEHVPI